MSPSPPRFAAPTIPALRPAEPLSDKERTLCQAIYQLIERENNAHRRGRVEQSPALMPVAVVPLIF